MALVPTSADPERPGRQAGPPPRMDPGRREALREAVDVRAAQRADAVLLAGAFADAVAALAAGLWTPAVATAGPLPAPPPARVADELGLTLHRAPEWHVAEGRQVAAAELEVDPGPGRERAARLAAAASAARRRGADTVLVAAGSRGYAGRTGLTLDQAERLLDRYGLTATGSLDGSRAKALAAEVPDALTRGRWRGRRWPAWALREAFADVLGADIAWPWPCLSGAAFEG